MKTSIAICILLLGMVAIASSQEQYDMTKAKDISKVMPWKCKTTDRSAQECPKYTVQGCLCVKGNTCSDSLTNKCSDCQNTNVIVSAEGINCRSLLGLEPEVPEGEHVEPEAETPVKNNTEPIINVTNITNITNDTTAPNTTNTSVVVNVTNDTPVINVTNKTTIPEAPEKVEEEEEAEKTKPVVEEEAEKTKPNATEKTEEEAEKKKPVVEEESEKTKPNATEKTEEEAEKTKPNSTEKTEEESEKTPIKPEKAEEKAEEKSEKTPVTPAKTEESAEKIDTNGANFGPANAGDNKEDEGQDIIVIDDDDNQQTPGANFAPKQDCGCQDNKQIDANSATIVINGGTSSYDFPATNVIYERYNRPIYRTRPRKSHFRYDAYQLAPISFYIPETAYVCQQKDRGLKMFNLQFNNNNLFTPSCVFYKDGSLQTLKTNTCDACNSHHVAAIAEGQGCHQFNNNNLFQLYSGY